MAVKFTYYGGMAVHIERSDGYQILVDPYFTGNPAVNGLPKEMYDVDLVLVTHAAFDHFGDTADIMKKQ